MAELPKTQWVALYLEPASDNSRMPAHVMGLLMQETAEYYILGMMVGERRSPQGAEEYFTEGLNMIRKPFVWRIEQLPGQPELNSVSNTNDDWDSEDGGGLG